MSNVQDWSTTAASNNSAAPNGFPEGMAPSGVNDAAREVMAAVKRWVDDVNGTLTSGGSSNAYTLTTNSSLSSVVNGDAFTFQANHTNTGAATLNVDSFAVDAIKDLAGNELVAGMIRSGGKHTVVFDGTDFILLNPYQADGFALPSADLYKRKTGDEVRNNTTTFSADTHLTGMNLIAGGVYELDGQLFYDIPTAASGDIKLSLSFSSAPTAARAGIYMAGAVGNLIDGWYQDDITDQTATHAYIQGPSAQDQGHALLRGVVVANAATTMELQWAQRSAVALDFTIRAHSYIRLRRVA